MSTSTRLLCLLFAFFVVSPFSRPAQSAVFADTFESVDRHGDCVRLSDGRNLCVRTDEEGISHWSLHRTGDVEAQDLSPATAMARVAEFQISPSGVYIAVVSVGEGHPILDVFEVAAVLAGESAEPKFSINPYPGSVSIKDWSGDTLLVNCDMPLTLAEDRRRDFELMFDDMETFSVAVPSGDVQAVSETAATTVTTLEGVVIEKPWTKTVESWNAGGSEYYVLDVGTAPLPDGKRSAKEGVILRPSTSVAFDEFKDFAGKRVAVVGKFIDPQVVEESSNSMEQHPATPVNPVTGKTEPLRRGGGFLVVDIRPL